MHRSSMQIAALPAFLAFVAWPASAQDGTPPSVIAGSVAFAVFPSPYAEVADPFTVTVGGEVRLGLTADEPLASAAVTFSGPETHGVTGTVAGGNASFSLQVTRQLAPGSYSATVRLVDLTGNAAEIALALPAPGFVVEDYVWSPCTLLNPDGSAVCSDVDADGRPGRSVACPLALDCDDTNPTIHPRAPEIPGDGTDNDCSGNGDVAVDETTGVFVSRRGSSSSQAGTRQRPFHKISDAIALALSTERVVFVSNESYSGTTAPSSVPVTLIGGFDPRSWTRAPFSRTTIEAASTMTVSAPLMVGVDVRLGTGADLSVASPFVTTLIDAGVTGPPSSSVRTTGHNRFARVEVAGPSLVVDSGTLVVIHSELGAIVAAAMTAVQLNRTVVSGPVTTAGNLAVIRGFHTAPFAADNAVMRLSSTTIRVGGAPAIAANAGVVTLYNNAIASASTGLAHTAQTIILVEHNVFDVGCPLQRDGACVSSPCGLNGNLCGTLSFTAAGDFHIAPGSTGTDGGLRYHPDKTASSSAVDIDGDCRVGELDIGADETP